MNPNVVWFAVACAAWLAGATVARAQEVAAVAPLTREEIRALVSERAPEDRVIAEIHRRGLGFAPVLEDLEALRAAGYSVDLMLVVARSTRPEGLSGTGARVAPAGEEDLEPLSAPEPEVFVNLSSMPQDLSACFALPPAVQRLPQADALEAMWTSLGGVAVLSEPQARIRLAGVLAVLGFPATACALVQDLPPDPAPGEDSIGCLLAVLDRIGAASVDCTVDPAAAWTRLDSSALASNVFDHFHYTVGRALVDSGADVALARKHLRSVRRDAPDFPRARLLLALAEARMGQADEARRLLSTLTGLGERMSQGVSIRDLAFINMARIAHEQGLYEEALANYRRIPTASRLWVDATYERAWAALAGGYYAEALGSVVALRSPLVRPRRFHDAWVVEVAAFEDHCLYREAARYARAWADELDRRLAEYEQALPGVGAFLQNCAPTCEEDPDEVIRPDTVVSRFPGLLAEPGLYGLLRTARQAQREERLVTGIATRSPAMVGLDAVATRAADLAVQAFRRAVVRAVTKDYRDLRLARARATDLLVDLEQEALDAFYGEARALAKAQEALPVPVLLREVERMTRDGTPSRDINLYLAMNGRGRAFSEDEFAALRHAGTAPDVLDFAQRFFGKAGPTRFELDPSGVDPRVLWGFSGEFWTDEMLGLRVELVDRCRSLVPQMPPGLR